MASMKLPDYIRHVGPGNFAKQIGVKERTVLSWMHKARKPRPNVALRICEKAPLTMADIYGQ